LTGAGACAMQNPAARITNIAIRRALFIEVASLHCKSASSRTGRP
jgi:hypothetical protein